MVVVAPEGPILTALTHVNCPFDANRITLVNQGCHISLMPRVILIMKGLILQTSFI